MWPAPPVPSGRRHGGIPEHAGGVLHGLAEDGQRGAVLVVDIGSEQGADGRSDLGLGERPGRAGGPRILVVRGDVLDQPVEAIVNPANENLHHLDGTARDIATAAGREIHLYSYQRDKDVLARMVRSTPVIADADRGGMGWLNGGTLCWSIFSYLQSPPLPFSAACDR